MPTLPRNGSLLVHNDGTRTSTRLLLRSVVVLLAFLMAYSNRLMADSTQLPAHYAESVMIGYISDDGTREISVRLARHPGDGRGEVWMSVAVPGSAWSVADDGFALSNPTATPVGADSVTFKVERKDQEVSFRSVHRQGSEMQGEVRGRLRLLETRDPARGPGQIPVNVDLRFKAGTAGFRVRGRWELTGEVQGDVTIDGHRYHFAGRGKWHEQTGPRAKFAPAFTYLNLENRSASLLAIGFKNRVTGYVLAKGKVHGVRSFTVDPQGAASRHFKLVLSDKQVIEGTAKIVQRWSVPIEGRRRPGTSVIAETTIGRMTGSLNDWNPVSHQTSKTRNKEK